MEQKKENFKRISENRTQKILTLIIQLKNLGNTSFYEYTDEQIDNMFDTINAELIKSRDFLKKSKKKDQKIEL